jgi:uncharacterized tellurite resistance protein B-like protein
MSDVLNVQRRIAAQLVVLTLIADGELANRELAALDRHRIAELLGVPREVLVQAVADHCQGLLARKAGSDALRLLDLEQTERMLDAVTEPALQKLCCQAMLVLAKSDGSISLPEQTLLRHALSRWGLTLDSVA